ncbi:MAG: NAD-dependent epimerase/dehydratase family protein [Thermoflavifilum sp.]|uniref:NAD-dependent epimerase/dehydratase family protein n=1 Tax=Thermoflavifilum sp. TaxID=1968839 RepID=UPI0018A5637D|nr:NAD-dependent epimerase/dehydratase family protein [Thermoflavifilum sp.]QOR76460.1 MAG: NAD-dependent epimerase/dehydratase family protein [Thermoflavifilum sp.]
MANIFVSGGTGFIGAYLVKRLIAANHIVHVLSRGSHASDSPQLQFYEGDITSAEAVQKAMQGCERAYHLAGYARAWHRDKQYYFQVNALGTQNIMQAAIAQGVKRVCLVSTAGILPPAVHGIPVNETARLRPELHTTYERSKWMGEQIARSYQQQVELVIVYPTKVYGPGPIDESNSATLMMRDYLSGKWHVIPGNGSGIMDYVYVEDVARGIELVMEKGRAGEAYVLGGEPASYNRFFELLKKLSQVYHPLFHVPVPLIYGITYVEWLKAKLGYKPLLTPEWVRKIPYDWSKSSEKARQELGYRARSLEEGMQLTLHWLKANPVEIFDDK